MLHEACDAITTFCSTVSDLSKSFDSFSKSVYDVIADIWPASYYNTLATTSLLAYVEHTLWRDAGHPAGFDYSYEDSDYDKAASWLNTPWEGVALRCHY